MADRRDYYFKQTVTQAELDAGFDGLEEADKEIIADLGLIGIITNGVVTEESPQDLTVNISGTMKARSPLGERLFHSPILNIDLSKDGNLPIGSGGIGDGVTTVVSGGSNEKWVSIFLLFDRLLSDPRIDGLGSTVFFVRTESFRYRIIQSAEEAAPIPIGSAPTTPVGAIRFADVRLAFGQTMISNADIDLTNRDDFDGFGSGVDLTAHLADTEDPHSAAQTITAQLLLGRSGAPTAGFLLEADASGTEQVKLHDPSTSPNPGVLEGDGLILPFGASGYQIVNQNVTAEVAVLNLLRLPGIPFSTYGLLGASGIIRPTIVGVKLTLPTVNTSPIQGFTGTIASPVFNVGMKAEHFQPVKDYTNITFVAADLPKIGLGRFVMAACRVNGSSGGFINTGHINVASAVRTSEGNYTITFDEPMTATYVAQTTISSGDGGMASVVTRSNTVILIRTHTRTGILLDRDFDLTITGVP